ncbi:MAG: RluA family pseudouridine synthase [Methylovirgula sp.]
MSSDLEPDDADLCLALDVATAEAGQRLDRFLVGRAETQGLSRTRLKNLVENGAVAVDGRPVAEAALKVKAGQKILLRIPPPEEAVPRGEPMPLSIRFEDEHLIVLDKPAGLVVHPAPGHATGTLVNGLIAHCGAELSGIGGVRRPGIVHRLDKDTSGLLVVAKSDTAHRGLAAIFADHGRILSLTREYLAFVWGVPERPAGTIATALARHRTDREKMAVAREGREAITHWRLTEIYVAPGGAPVASLLTCSLETGRTHQIRVHLAHIGHPVLGDPLYGRGFKTKATLLGVEAQALLAALGRQALHATTLGFAHPISGKAYLFESALPEDLKALHTTLAASR